MCDDVITHVPWPKGVPATALAVPDVYLLPCQADDPDHAWSNVCAYMRERDAHYGGVLLWFVQLCRTNEIGGT